MESGDLGVFPFAVKQKGSRSRMREVGARWRSRSGLAE